MDFKSESIIARKQHDTMPTPGRVPFVAESKQFQGALMKAERDTIAELCDLYVERTKEKGQESSFYVWLDAIGIEPNEAAWVYVLEHPDEYEWR